MPGAWLSAVESGSGESAREAYSTDEMLEERLLMGLRLTEGVDIGENSADLEDKISNINGLSGFPLITIDGTQLRLTPEGRPLLNSVLKELLA